MKPPILIDADVMGGVPVIRGTRVPVQNLFDHIEAGEALPAFLEAFPGVSSEMAIQVLEYAKTQAELAAA